MGIAALVLFILVTVAVNVVLKRDIAEALLLALLAAALLGGTDAPRLLLDGVTTAAQSDVTYAGVAFVFMGVVVQATGLINRLIAILNSVFGRLRGGAAYVSTLGSAMIGMVAGNTAGNAATVGSVTIPWMKQTGWPKAHAASLVAGNSGLGVALPPNSTMFILIALPVSAGASSSNVYIALLTAGIYAVLYRLGVVYLWTRRLRIPPTPIEDREPFGQAVREGWKSPLIFFGILIPVLLTIGPLSNWLAEAGRVGEDGIGSISIIVWVPILITLIAVMEGFSTIRRDVSAFMKSIRGGGEAVLHRGNLAVRFPGRGERDGGPGSR
ncbi:MAG: TRAP transporter large permease subunit [Mycobacteriaceae bacterium]